MTSRRPGGVTPLHGACKGGHSRCLEVLITAGADINSHGGDINSHGVISVPHCV